MCRSAAAEGAPASAAPGRHTGVSILARRIDRLRAWCSVGGGARTGTITGTGTSGACAVEGARPGAAPGGSDAAAAAAATNGDSAGNCVATSGIQHCRPNEPDTHSGKINHLIQHNHGFSASYFGTQ